MPETSLKEAFNIQPGEVISLVGAGGKSTLMAMLARELSAGGSSVITTTTTKILEWQAPGERLIIEADGNKLVALAADTLRQENHITIASKKLADIKKLDGVSPHVIDRLAEQADYIIVEADGAARKPLKAPNATEPMIPESTSLVIAVAGIEALGKELNRDNIFRPEIFSELTGLEMGEAITSDAVASLIVHDEGIAKGSPPSASIIPFINKIDTEEDKIIAGELAQKILKAGHPRIKRMVLGRLQPEPPSVSVIYLPLRHSLY